MTKYDEATETSNQSSVAHTPKSFLFHSQDSPDSIVASRSGSLPINNRYGRSGSYLDVTEDDFEILSVAQRWPSLIDEATQVAPSRTKRHPSISCDYAHKKARISEIEIIDLTDSPPKKRDTLTASFPPPSSAVPENRSIRSQPTSSARFTLDDCSPEQKYVLKLVTQGENVFYTGPAGVGKSFVLNKICQLFENRNKKRFIDFFITASTGNISLFRGTKPQELQQSILAE